MTIKAPQGVPSPHPCTTWPAADVAYVGFRFYAIGAEETVAWDYIDACAAQGVRRLRAYVSNATNTQLIAFAASGARLPSYLYRQRRRPLGWPGWRTSSDRRQPSAGHMPPV